MANRGIWSNDRYISNPTRKQRRKVHRMLKYVDSPFFDTRSRWFRRNVSK